MKRLLMSVTLAVVLSPSALAGDIPSGGIPAPATTEPTGATSPGLIPSDGMSDQLSSEALSALMSVLGLLAR